MQIREKLTADMKDAMRAKDSVRLDAIRFLQAAIKNRNDPATIIRGWFNFDR